MNPLPKHALNEAGTSQHPLNLLLLSPLLKNAMPTPSLKPINLEGNARLSDRQYLGNQPSALIPNLQLESDNNPVSRPEPKIALKTLSGKGTTENSSLLDLKLGEILSPSKKILKMQSFQSRRSWSESEDKKIIEMVEKHGLNWSLLSRLVGGSRTGKQIRDRYLNKLNPGIKNNKWTSEEDALLLRLYKIHGRKWSKISKQMPGRSEVMVKNRFYSKFSKAFEGNAENLTKNDDQDQLKEVLKYNRNGHKEDAMDRESLRNSVGSRGSGADFEVSCSSCFGSENEGFESESLNRKSKSGPRYKKDYLDEKNYSAHLEEISRIENENKNEASINRNGLADLTTMQREAVVSNNQEESIIKMEHVEDKGGGELDIEKIEVQIQEQIAKLERALEVSRAALSLVNILKSMSNQNSDVNKRNAR